MFGITQPLMPGGNTSTPSRIEEPMDTDEPCPKSVGFYQALNQPDKVGKYIFENPGLLTAMSSQELASMINEVAKTEYECHVIQHILDISESMYSTIKSWPSPSSAISDESALMQLLQFYRDKKLETDNECYTLELRVISDEKKTLNWILESNLTENMAKEFIKVLGQPIMHLNSEEQAELRTAIEEAGCYAERNIKSSILKAKEFKDLAKYPLHMLYMLFLANFIDYCENNGIEAKKGGAFFL